jgi:hypothetical protein
MNGATHADGVAVSKNHTHSQYLPLATGGRVNGPIYGYFPSTRNTMVGHEYNCFINAKERGVLSFEQSGTGQLSTDQVWALFDGKLEPQYSSTGIDSANPYVLTLSLNKYGSTHTQAFVAFGWTCRYWWPVRYKVEAYNTYQSANTWVVLCDYSNVDNPAVNLFIPFGSDTTNPHTGNRTGGCFTKFRITIYKGDSTTTPANRWGISEIFYCFPEAYKLHSGLSVYSSETALGITRSLASSGTISATNIVNVSGSTDGFKMDYSSTSADAGKMTIYTIDDSNASISIGNNVSGTYKEAVSIVNGSATITGSLTGTASTAQAYDTSFTGTNSIKSALDGKASTSHTHSEIYTPGDQRDTATAPTNYNNKLKFAGMKRNSVIGNPSSDTYSYIVGLRGWNNYTGGLAHELAFNNTGIFSRTQTGSDEATWGSWSKLYTSSNLTSQSPSSGGTTVSLCTNGEKATWNAKQDALTVMTDTEVSDLLAAMT